MDQSSQNSSLPLALNHPGPDLATSTRSPRRRAGHQQRTDAAADGAAADMPDDR